MALTLNDEQEAALRQWWSRYGDGTGYGQRTLHEAIAPLMKPWRVSGPFDHAVIRHDATNRSIELKCYGNNSEAYKALAQRICDLLNESEASR